MEHLGRRDFLRTLGAAGTLTAFGLRRSLVYAAEKTITVTSLGGKWEQSIRNHFIPLFKRRTGVDVKVVLGGPAQWMAQLESQPKSPPIDAIDNSETLAFSLIDKGLAVKLTSDKVPNLIDTPDLFRKPWDDYGAMYMYAASGFVYNKEKIKNPPTSWKEFFDRTAAGEFGRNVSLPDIAYPWTPAFLWVFAKTFGGGTHNMDPAFTMLKKVKPYVVKFWIHAVEFEKMATTKEIDIGVFWDGRSYAMIDGGAKFMAFQRLEADSLISGVVSQVVKGGNEELALKYVNTLLDPEPQLEYFKLINYAVTNRRVEYPVHLKDRVMPVQFGTVAPYRELARITPNLLERWNQEIRL